MYNLNKANGYGTNKQGKSLQMWVIKKNKYTIQKRIKPLT